MKVLIAKFQYDRYTVDNIFYVYACIHDKRDRVLFRCYRGDFPYATYGTLKEVLESFKDCHFLKD
jgi:hypothetical protein